MAGNIERVAAVRRIDLLWNRVGAVIDAEPVRRVDLVDDRNFDGFSVLITDGYGTDLAFLSRRPGQRVKQIEIAGVGAPGRSGNDSGFPAVRKVGRVHGKHAFFLHFHPEGNAGEERPLPDQFAEFPAILERPLIAPTALAVSGHVVIEQPVGDGREIQRNSELFQPQIPEMELPGSLLKPDVQEEFPQLAVTEEHLLRPTLRVAARRSLHPGIFRFAGKLKQRLNFRPLFARQDIVRGESRA